MKVYVVKYYDRGYGCCGDSSEGVYAVYDNEGAALAAVAWLDSSSSLYDYGDYESHTVEETFKR